MNLIVLSTNGSNELSVQGSSFLNFGQISLCSSVQWEDSMCIACARIASFSRIASCSLNIINKSLHGAD